MKTGDSQKLYADLSLTLEQFWEGFTGVRPAHVRLIASEREIAAVWKKSYRRLNNRW